MGGLKLDPPGVEFWPEVGGSARWGRGFNPPNPPGNSNTAYRHRNQTIRAYAIRALLKSVLSNIRPERCFSWFRLHVLRVAGLVGPTSAKDKDKLDRFQSKVGLSGGYGTDPVYLQSFCWESRGSWGATLPLHRTKHVLRELLPPPTSKHYKICDQWPCTSTQLRPSTKGW